MWNQVMHVWNQALPVLSIVFSIGMVLLGLFAIIIGEIKLRQYKLKGLAVRILGAVLFLGAAAYFIPKVGLAVETIIALAVILTGYILSEKPARAQHLTAGTHHYQSGPDEPTHRLHLRLEKDGTGVLILNAATVLHLNPTAAEFAYHMIKGSSPDAAAEEVAHRYHIDKATALKDYTDFRDRVQTLIHTPGLDPTTYLDFDRVAPHSKDLSAPLRLDCALTYRLPEGTQSEDAPTKRVDRELTTAEWETIMDKAWAVGIPHVTFTGGEPTLREDLPELITYGEKIGQVTGVLTDGLKLTNKDYLNTLLQTGLDHLLFILQPENEASWNALAAIIPEDLIITVHLTVTPQNVKMADEILERLAKLGIKSLSLSTSEASLLETLHAMHNRIASLGITLRWDLPVPYSRENPVAHETIEDEVPSGAGKAWLYVEPDGDVLPAQGMADKILGNLLRDPWEKIYN